MKESKEHVCPECDQAYKDVIDLTAQYNPICIDCAAESYYNSRGHKLDKNARMTFHYHRYNAGLYPQSRNYVDGGLCPQISLIRYSTKRGNLTYFIIIYDF